ANNEAYRADYQSMEMEHDRFEKVLKASDVERLGVTTTMLEMLPPEDPDRDIPIRVFDNQKWKVYEFKLSSRQRGRYKNPVFQSRGWRVFVNDRGIAAGDVLYFWEEEDPFHGTQYRIALYKPKLFPHL
ncbi:PREDICTED: B3 domain-containing mRNAion factor NGA4, partial [Prunus dulcis]